MVARDREGQGVYLLSVRSDSIIGSVYEIAEDKPRGGELTKEAIIARWAAPDIPISTIVACFRRRVPDGQIDLEVCAFGSMSSGLYRRSTSPDGRYRAAIINLNSKRLGPKFQLNGHGRSGAELPELLPHLAEVSR